MGKKTSDEDAVCSCSDCTSFICGRCEILGIITAEKRHLCYTAGYSMLRLGRTHNGKVPRRPPCP